MTFQLAIWWLSTQIPFIISARLVVDVDAFPFLEIQFQQIPLVYDEELLFKLRENFMVVEFFEKERPKDFLIGISKLPLHQFYLAYRNPVVVKYLSERKFPVIGTDGWESVFNPNDGEVVGQAQILVALGTKEQIDHLESERGFKNSIVKAKTAPIFKTADVGVQSNMEPKENIEALLKQLVAKKEEHSVRMENSTNTEPVRDTTTNTEPEVRTSANISPETRISPNVSETRTSPSTIPEVRSTSDLLNSLQKALSIDNIKEKSFFKAHVAINSALHLPSRRKCKSKRSKGRNGKSEDILPSTYVSFEGHKGDLKITPIVPKSTNPKWDFRCDVALPLEYLTDNQKFLVFKVWRKSTNTTMTPNMQTDHVIGFATVDLTVLSAGLPSIQGWFNINDLSKKCNGQINVISVVSLQPDTRVFVYRST
jgi:C2 domain-containing protein 3